MNAIKLKNSIAQCISDLTFTYSGKKCGIEVEVSDSKPVYTMWFGGVWVELTSADDVMETPLFDGKSLSDICEEITIHAE